MSVIYSMLLACICKQTKLGYRMARLSVIEDINVLTKQLITSLTGFQVIVVGISCLLTLIR